MKNFYSLDSLKLLIPLENIDKYDKNLNKETLLIYSDFWDGNDQIIQHNKRSPLIVEFQGFKITYGYTSLFGNEYVYVLFNSKFLKHRYFEGITKSNIKIIYDFIISHGIISLSFSSFLNSNTVDTDIKYDFDLYEEQFVKFIYDRKNQIKYSKIFADSPNLGIQYNNRQSAKPSSPFVKYYSKFQELDTRSKLFKDTYLPKFSNENLRRCEVTIKNSSHRLFLERKTSLVIPKTLLQWLNLSQISYKKIFLSCVNQHENDFAFKPIKKVSRNVNQLSSTKYFIYCMMLEYKKLGYSPKMLLNLYDQRIDISDKVHTSQKSRLKKLLKQLQEIEKQSIFESNINPF